MTDIYDQASEREERDRAEALASRKPVGPPACGACYWCGEPLKGERRFCDKFCSDDYTYAEERKQIPRI